MAVALCCWFVSVDDGVSWTEFVSKVVFYQSQPINIQLGLLAVAKQLDVFQQTPIDAKIIKRSRLHWLKLRVKI